MSVMEAPAATEALTDAERERLAHLEQRISQGLDAFVAAGRALHEIRERGLFREHGTFKAYVEQRWMISQPRAYSLLYSAAVMDALEAAGESPQGSEAALREFSVPLHRDGPEATVEAFRRVSDDGVLPSATETRQRLVDAGLVDRPKRSPADDFKKRLTILERVAPRLESHPKLTDLYLDYAGRLRGLVALLETLAEEALPPVVPPGALCLRHGARRDERGICKDCRRPDLSDNARAGAVAA